MSESEVIDVYFPPEPIEANKVGQVIIFRDNDFNSLRMTFLIESFGKEKRM